MVRGYSTSAIRSGPSSNVTSQRFHTATINKKQNSSPFCHLYSSGQKRCLVATQAVQVGSENVRHPASALGVGGGEALEGDCAVKVLQQEHLDVRRRRDAHLCRRSGPCTRGSHPTGRSQYHPRLKRKKIKRDSIQMESI